MWGRLPLAGLLLAGCSFDPGGSSSGDPPADPPAGAADAAPLAPVPFDAAPPAPDAAPPVLLETLVVPATGEVVESTVVLALGAGYRLIASGTVTIRDGYSADADYWWDDGLPGIVADGAFGADIGLAVDDTDVNSSRAPDWGAFSGDHLYEAAVVGTGEVLTAQFHDGNPDNNSGSLTLEIHGPP